jgi:hypothetical protein
MQRNHTILLVVSPYISTIFYILLIIRFYTPSNLLISSSQVYLIIIRTFANETNSLSLQRTHSKIYNCVISTAWKSQKIFLPKFVTYLK